MRAIISRAGHAPQRPSVSLPSSLSQSQSPNNDNDNDTNTNTNTLSAATAREYMTWFEDVSFYVANLLSLVQQVHSDEMIAIVRTEERLSKLMSILKNPAQRETCCVQ